MTFPHYTWGCIVWSRLQWCATEVPSLYVRVYRILPQFSPPLNCSLTIREGVSRTKEFFLCGEGFPHYTWGCIEMDDKLRRKEDVPSLYVRVYRARPCCQSLAGCSLTIREGVSVLGWGSKRAARFPHYTWGCIGEDAKRASLAIVPSLYVRVYRRCYQHRQKRGRSLTIREGVSDWQEKTFPGLRFPHYTWGCIGF